jgi:hypothetical protein
MSPTLYHHVFVCGMWINCVNLFDLTNHMTGEVGKGILEGEGREIPVVLVLVLWSRQSLLRIEI